MKVLKEVFERSFKTMKRTEISIMHKVNERILHGILGIVDEAGEFIKLVKDRIYYNKPDNMTNLKEELGDLWWYYTLLLDEIAILDGKTPEETFSEILNMNRAKLESRYPDKYSDEKAQNRDLGAEEKALKSEENK